jgi:GAF domain-containing protein
LIQHSLEAAGSAGDGCPEADQRQNASLRALHETALGLLDKIDKEELLETIIERAASLTGTEHGYIYLLEPETQVMQMRVGKGFFSEQLGRSVRMGEGMGGCVWQAESPGACGRLQQLAGATGRSSPGRPARHHWHPVEI